MTGTPAIGLDRLPREVAHLLEESAENAALAAADLAQLLTEGDERLAREIERREAAGDRITHDLARALRNGRIAARDRGSLRALAETIDDLLDEIDATARDAATCRCGSDAALASQVLRDMARANARAVRLLDEPGAELADELAAVRLLHNDGKRLFRKALAETLEARDPLIAIARQGCLDHIGGGIAAASRVGSALERVSLARRG